MKAILTDYSLDYPLYPNPNMSASFFCPISSTPHGAVKIYFDQVPPSFFGGQIDLTDEFEIELVVKRKHSTITSIIVK